MAPLLLHNEAGGGEPLARREAAGHDGATATRSARASRWSAGGVVRERLKTGGGSYLSSHDPRLVLGLGAARGVDWVEVRVAAAERPRRAVRGASRPTGTSRSSRARGRPRRLRPAAVAGAVGWARMSPHARRPSCARPARSPQPPAAPAAPPPAPAQPAPQADPYTRVQQAQGRSSSAGQYARVLQIVDGAAEGVPAARSRATCCARWPSTSSAGCDEAERSYRGRARSVAPGDPQILARFGMHHLRRDELGRRDPLPRAERRQQPRTRSRTSTSRRPTSTRTRRARRSRRSRRAAQLAPRNPTILVKLGEYRAQASKLLAGARGAAARAAAQPEGARPRPRARGRAPGPPRGRGRPRRPRAGAREGPDNLAALSSLAQACSKARDHAAARGYYQRLIDLGHHDAPYHLGLGAALLGLGENEAAIAALTGAAAAEPRARGGATSTSRARTAPSAAPRTRSASWRRSRRSRRTRCSPFDERSDLERDLWRRGRGAARRGQGKGGARAPGRRQRAGQPARVPGGRPLLQARPLRRRRAAALARAARPPPDLPKLRAYLGLACLEQGRVAEAEAGDPGGGRAEPARAVRADGAGPAALPQEGVEGGRALPAGVEGRRARRAAHAVRGAARGAASAPRRGRRRSSIDDARLRPGPRCRSRRGSCSSATRSRSRGALG